MDAALKPDPGYDGGRDPREKAKENGWHVEAADDRVLQLDLDGPEGQDAHDLLPHRMRFLSQLIDGLFAGYDIHYTRSPGGGRHVYICLNQAWPVATRIAWQLFLGSDKHREVRSLADHACNPKRPPVLLFESDAYLPGVKIWMADRPAPCDGKVRSVAAPLPFTDF